MIASAFLRMSSPVLPVFSVLCTIFSFRLSHLLFDHQETSMCRAWGQTVGQHLGLLAVSGLFVQSLRMWTVFWAVS